MKTCIQLSSCLVRPIYEFVVYSVDILDSPKPSGRIGGYFYFTNYCFYIESTMSSFVCHLNRFPTGSKNILLAESLLLISRTSPGYHLFSNPTA